MHQTALQKSPNRNAIWALLEGERIAFGKQISLDEKWSWLIVKLNLRQFKN